MPDSQLTNSRILIVDDQESNLALLEGLLKKQGYSNYKSLSDSRQVLPTVQEWEPDLILLDLMMPHMDGFAVMQALKPHIAQDDYLPILVLTADITSEAKMRALSGGAVDFLTKPFDVSEVILRVGNLLQTRFLHRQLQNQNVLLEAKVVERTAELRESEARARVLLNAMPDMMFRLNRNGVFLDYKADQSELYAQSEDTLIGKRNRDISPSEFGDLIEHFIKVTLTTAEMQIFEYQLPTPGRGLRTYEARMVPSGADEVTAIVRDITERKQAETERQALLEIMQGLANTDDLHEFLKLIHRSIASVIYAENFFVVFYNQDSGLFEEIYTVDKYDQPASPSALEKSITSYVFRSGQPLLLTQVLFDKLVAQGEVELVGTNSESWLGAPLKTQNSMIGVIVVQHYENPNSYTERDRDFLASIGSQVALAIERKQAEGQLNYHARLLRHINDAVIAIDDQFRITAWNRAAEKMYGWSSAEVMGRNVAETLGSRLTDQQRAEAEELLKKYSSSRSERIHSTKNGQPVYVEENTIALTDQRGRISGYVSVNRDITMRKQAEENIMASELRYRRLFEAAKDGILILDAETGLIVDVNPFMIEMLGFSKEEFLGKQLWELGFFKDIVESKANFLELQQKGYMRYEDLPLETTNGRRFHVEFVSNVYQVGRNQVIQCNVHDITERKRAEAQIQRQLQHLNSLRTIDTAISSSFDIRVTLDIVLQQVLSQLGVDAAAVILLNPHGQTMEYAASRGFQSNTRQHAQLKLSAGYASRVVSERRMIHIPDLSATSGELAEAMHLANEEFVDYYGIALIVKGEVKGVLEIYHRSQFKSNPEWLDFLETLAGQAAIAIDNAQLFEDLQRANAELEQRVAQRTEELNQTNIELEHANRAKDEFLATMSHELRTPLSSILGLSETLLEKIRGPLNEKQEQALQMIASSGTHLLGLINDILDVSKVEAGKMDIYPDVVNVREICQSSLNFIKEAIVKKSITVDFQVDPSISTVFADLQRLKQILVNLLSNAVKFTPEGGKVTFDVTTNLERDQIRFSISDNGIGIAPDDLKKLFRPFMQANSSLARQNQGTGLGLTIVYKLTELHGGSVQVESEVGKGSRFIVILPWNQAIMTKENIGTGPANMEKPAEATRESEQMSDFRFKILIAEDNEANQTMFNDYLQEQGFEVSLANNGIEALAKAEETLPDLIIMDIQMPEMHGLEATQRLRADPRFASTPIIALTALAMPGDRERCLEAGANEYISKPASLRKLLLTINEMLDRGK
jgi:PAS domain S-box-containing protein